MQNVPRLPDPPEQYDRRFMASLIRSLSTYFVQLSATKHINAASLNLDTSTLPTEADVATLRVGDVYMDTTASNVLKVKT